MHKQEKKSVISTMLFYYSCLSEFLLFALSPAKQHKYFIFMDTYQNKLIYLHNLVFTELYVNECICSFECHFLLYDN